MQRVLDKAVPNRVYNADEEFQSTEYDIDDDVQTFQLVFDRAFVRDQPKDLLCALVSSEWFINGQWVKGPGFGIRGGVLYGFEGWEREYTHCVWKLRQASNRKVRVKVKSFIQQEIRFDVDLITTPFNQIIPNEVITKG